MAIEVGIRSRFTKGNWFNIKHESFLTQFQWGEKILMEMYLDIFWIQVTMSKETTREKQDEQHSKRTGQ